MRRFTKIDYRLLSAIFFILIPFLVNSLQAVEKEARMGATKVKVTIGEISVTATIYDNPTAKDFLAMLPLTLTLQDYASTEKVSDLPKKLTSEGAPKGSKPSVGDITYYAPWGNLALFYKDFEYSNGLIILGKIDSSMDVFKSSKPFKAKFEIVD